MKSFCHVDRIVAWHHGRNFREYDYSSNLTTMWDFAKAGSYAWRLKQFKPTDPRSPFTKDADGHLNGEIGTKKIYLGYLLVQREHIMSWPHSDYEQSVSPGWSGDREVPLVGFYDTNQIPQTLLTRYKKKASASLSLCLAIIFYSKHHLKYDIIRFIVMKRGARRNEPRLTA